MKKELINKYKDFIMKKYNKNAVFVGSGWSSIAFWVDGLIIRFPQQNIDDYYYEAFLCNRIRDLISFDVPQAEIIHDEFVYVKHRCIPGRTWVQMPKKNCDKLAADCALFLSEIHGLRGFDIRKVPCENPIPTYMLEDTLKLYFSAKTVTKICMHYADIVYKQGVGTVLLHGDFNGNNSVIDDRNRLVGVFDWCNSGIGEREKDFVQLYNDREAAFFQAVVKEYLNYCGVVINTEHIQELAFVELINKLYWTKQKVIVNKMLNTLRNKCYEFIS